MARLHPLFLLCLLVAAAAAMANPPAPSYTLYGTVRTTDGRPLDTGEGLIVLSTVAGAEIVRGPTNAEVGRGLNYALQVPMDSFTTDELYKETATSPKTIFKVQVFIGTKTYVPYAVGKPPLDTEQPGDRERFDFVIGTDSDNDDIPDEYEKTLVDADSNDALTKISQITASGDINGNGLTNYQEYLAGLYGAGASSGIFLSIIKFENGIAQLEFLAARGRTYSIRTSTDLRNWVEIPFALDPAAVKTGSHYRAKDSDYLNVYVPGVAPQPNQPAHFFKLYVE
jgi:hypothetical protein